ncbi:MAG TPA: YceI family protein [Roseiflexaceae bacterium]|nr:YceI family protein [Roseiflexaceae bacterium]
MAWQIDPAHSEIQFSAKHMMISTVRGRFNEFTGTVDGDEANPTAAKVEVKIDASTLVTGDEKRDTHLRSPDFLDVEKYPYLTFKSTRVEQVDDSHGKLYGDLTIRDVTNPVVLDFEYAGQAKTPWGTTSAGFNATTKINRKDWDLNWNVALETGGWLVSDQIRIDIELELIKQVEQAQDAETVAA